MWILFKYFFTSCHLWAAPACSVFCFLFSVAVELSCFLFFFFLSPPQIWPTFCLLSFILCPPRSFFPTLSTSTSGHLWSPASPPSRVRRLALVTLFHCDLLFASAPLQQPLWNGAQLRRLLGRWRQLIIILIILIIIPILTIVLFREHCQLSRHQQPPPPAGH